jgi:hypothetical protein
MRNAQKRRLSGNERNPEVALYDKLQAGGLSMKGNHLQVRCHENCPRSERHRDRVVMTAPIIHSHNLSYVEIVGFWHHPIGMVLCMSESALSGTCWCLRLP